MLEIRVFLHHTKKVNTQNYLIFTLYFENGRIIRRYPKEDGLTGLFFRIDNEIEVYTSFAELDIRLVDILNERARRWSGPI